MVTKTNNKNLKNISSVIQQIYSYLIFFPIGDVARYGGRREASVMGGAARRVQFIVPLEVSKLLTHL